MGIQIPVGFALVTQQILQTGGSHPYIISWGVSAPIADDATEIATNERARFKTHVWDAATRGNNWALGECTARLNIGGGIITVGLDATNNPGTVAANVPPPPNSAVLVKKVTGVAGRRYRGRFYVPCFLLGEADVDGLGLITSAALSSIQLWFNAWRAAQVAATYVPCLLHEDGSTGTPITAYSVQQRLATQRRRLRA